MQKRIAPRRRNWLISIGLILPGQDDRADDRHQQNEREGPEWQQVRIEDAVADGADVDAIDPRIGTRELLVLEATDEGDGHRGEQQQCDRYADRSTLVVEVVLGADAGPREHHTE